MIGSYRLPTHRRSADRIFSMIPSYFQIENKILAKRSLRMALAVNELRTDLVPSTAK